MAVAQRKIFSSSTVADGAWQDISLYEVGNLSIHVVGIEAGATVTVELSNNSAPAQVNLNADPPATAGVSTTLTPTGNQALYAPATYAHWVRVRKTVAGGSPTTTIANFCGLLEA